MGQVDVVFSDFLVEVNAVFFNFYFTSIITAGVAEQEKRFPSGLSEEKKNLFIFFYLLLFLYF